MIVFTTQVIIDVVFLQIAINVRFAGQSVSYSI
jgi:hypothetical protein